MKTLHRLTLSGLFVAALGMAGAAQAHDNVYWSVGIASPGVSVGVSSMPPVAVYPAPVYVQPYPAVMVPRPVYYAAPPAPVYYGPPPGWGRGHGHGYGYGRGWYGGERHWGRDRD